MQVFEAIRLYFVERSALHLARDAFDIFVVYLVVYLALRVIRGTRAMQVGVGIGVVFLGYLLARTLQLVTVLSVMDTLLGSIILVLVVVFQNDIRRALMRVGSRGRDWFGSPRRTREAEMIDEVVDAVTELARHRIGALITFERDANLDEFVGTHKGHTVDAKVTAELLVSLFLPEAMNKLHDGSLIIRDYRIAKAGVFFPMPEGRVMDEGFGSRHRAALGITEETDAVVVVVSEERGTISFCFNGNIIPGLDGSTLRKSLEDFFTPKPRKKKPKAAAPPESTAAEVVEEAPPSLRGVELAEELRADIETTAPIRISRPTDPEPTAEPDGERPPPLRARGERTERTSASERGDGGSEPPPAPLRKALRDETPSPASSTAGLQVVPMPTAPESSQNGSPTGADEEAGTDKPGGDS